MLLRSFSKPIKINKPPKLEIKIVIKKEKQKLRDSSGEREIFHQEKSLKELILNKNKNGLIQKIQAQLSSLHSFRIFDRTIFYLAWYINHYQSLEQLISKGLQNINENFSRFKNHSTKVQSDNVQTEQPASWQSQRKTVRPKRNIQTERNSPQKNEVQVIMDSYKFKCLKEFFGIEQYGSEQMIVKTVVQKIQEKIKKQEIKVMDSKMPTLRRISIVQHKREPSDPSKMKENTCSPLRPHHLNSMSININTLPKIQQQHQVLETVSAPQNRIEPKKHLAKKVNLVVDEESEHESKHESKKQTPLLKNIKNETRRNGIHELNKILVQIEELKSILLENSSHGDDVMNRASILKARLNNLLCNLIVKPLGRDKGIKAKDLNFNKLR